MATPLQLTDWYLGLNAAKLRDKYASLGAASTRSGQRVGLASQHGHMCSNTKAAALSQHAGNEMTKAVQARATRSAGGGAACNHKGRMVGGPSSTLADALDCAGS